MSGMSTREAACSCGRLRLTVEGDPFEVSMCHCLACQRRTGSAFGLQARYPADRVQMAGASREYARTSTEPDERVHAFHFCPDCGGTVYYTEPDDPEIVVVMVGAFADRDFPAPVRSSYGTRRHRWLALPEGIQSDEVWDELRPLYGAGDYAAVADRGAGLIAAHPDERAADLQHRVLREPGRAHRRCHGAPAPGDRDRPRSAARPGGRGLGPGRDPRRAGVPGARRIATRATW